MLTNAVYFQSDWANKFDPNSTRAGSFTLESGEPVEVSMMHELAGYGYMSATGSRFSRFRTRATGNRW